MDKKKIEKINPPDGKKYDDFSTPPQGARILFLAANPKGEQSLDIPQEADNLQDAILESSNEKGLDLRSFLKLTPDKLIKYLRSIKPTILHFSGHGTGTSFLMVTNAGYGLEVDNMKINELVAEFSDTIQCVVFNACHSDAQAKALITHIPNVIGTTTAIGDEDAIKFSKYFYEGLCKGESYERAFRIAIKSVELLKKDAQLVYYRWQNETERQQSVSATTITTTKKAVNEADKMRFEIAKINCDRTAVLHDFEFEFERMEEDLLARVQHYVVFEPKFHQADYALKRMLLLLKNQKRKNLHLREEIESGQAFCSLVGIAENYDVDKFIFALRKAINEQLENPVRIKTLADWQAGTETARFKQLDYLPILLRIPYFKSSWKNFLQKGLLWLFSEFASVNDATAHKFLFFLVLEDEDNTDISKETKALTKKQKNLAVLSPLELVTKKHIYDWVIENKLTDNQEVANDLCKEIISQLKEPMRIEATGQEGWTMSHVSRYLAIFWEKCFLEEHIHQKYGKL